MVVGGGNNQDKAVGRGGEIMIEGSVGGDLDGGGRVVGSGGGGTIPHGTVSYMATYIGDMYRCNYSC